MAAAVKMIERFISSHAYIPKMQRLSENKRLLWSIAKTTKTSSRKDKYARQPEHRPDETAATRRDPVSSVRTCGGYAACSGSKNIGPPELPDMAGSNVVLEQLRLR
jgi:hypothetical protein